MKEFPCGGGELAAMAALDEQAIVQKIPFGAAQPLTAPMAPAVSGYCNTNGTNSCACNPTKAKQHPPWRTSMDYPTKSS